MKKSVASVALQHSIVIVSRLYSSVHESKILCHRWELVGACKMDHRVRERVRRALELVMQFRKKQNIMDQ